MRRKKIPLVRAGGFKLNGKADEVRFIRDPARKSGWI